MAVTPSLDETKPNEILQHSAASIRNCNKQRQTQPRRQTHKKKKKIIEHKKTILFRRFCSFDQKLNFVYYFVFDSFVYCSFLLSAIIVLVIV